VGEWRIDATSGDHDRIGSTVLSVQSGGTASASIYLRKVRHRVFSISGAADADGVRWTSLEGPDAAEGTLSLSSISDAKGVDTDLPDGRTRFELTRAGEVIGTPISLRVTSAGPIVLAW